MLVVFATLAFLVPSIPGFHGDPDRHSLAIASIPVSIVLLVVYGVVILDNLRRHRRAHQEAETEPHDTAWSLPASLVVLGIATIATAFVSEILVHTLDHFADAAPLSELFVSAVIVAIVGNAAEHGGAIVIARRGKMKLATEIAVSSSAQVSMLVVPAVCLLSFVVKPALPLAFRPIELIAMGASAFFVAIVIRDGWVRRWEGTMLIAVYAGLVVAFALAGIAKVGPDQMTENGQVVKANEVTRRYGSGETAVEALRGVTLGVDAGKLTAVMGPSGSGKSTLMHILAGLDHPTSGTVVLDGTEITDLDDNDLTKLRRRSIGFVFQFFNLLPMLTAEENVLLPLSIAGEKPDPAWIKELLENVGLTKRASHRPAELSGGEQQRVAIARALVSRPTVMFADEPTGNLDSRTSGEILELLRSSVESYGQTTVMVTHDSRAAAIADRILFLGDGLIVRELGRTDPDQVLAAMAEIGG